MCIAIIPFLSASRLYLLRIILLFLLLILSPVSTFIDPKYVIISFIALLICSAYLRVLSTRSSALVSAQLTSHASSSLFSNILSAKIDFVETLSTSELQSYFSTYLEYLAIVINGIFVFVSCLLVLLVFSFFHSHFFYSFLHLSYFEYLLMVTYFF